MTSISNTFCSKLFVSCFNHKLEAKSELNIDSEYLEEFEFEETENTLKGSKKIQTLQSLDCLQKQDSGLASSTVSTKDSLLDLTESKSLSKVPCGPPYREFELEVLEGGNFAHNKKLVLASSGLFNGEKTKEEGSLLIGCDLEGAQSLVNDISCNSLKGNRAVQAAKICFKSKTMNLCEMGSKDGLYVKIDEKLLLENGSIFHYGIGHFFVQVVDGIENMKSKLILKFIDGSMEGQERTFDSDQVCTIGRLETCTFSSQEYGLSKIQCKIYFSKGKWYIIDGDGPKKSTNGTWRLVQNTCTVKHRTVFKVCDTVFRVKVYGMARQPTGYF